LYSQKELTVFDTEIENTLLCLEALGSAFGCSILDGPWIQKKNWND
jgi:hypothetical protein